MVVFHNFIYGRPVQSHEFLNREPELGTVFNRLRNGESTAVVGEPHIGKTSLLLKLADSTTLQDYLGDDACGLVLSLLDLHTLGNDYTPKAFWEQALEPLKAYSDFTERLEQVAQENYPQRSLEQLFNYMAQRSFRLVLLLDEFERLLTHPNFQDPGFFGLLRSVASTTRGLVLVPASRLSVSEMNERGRGLLCVGSPFFNIMIEIRLRPFDEQSATMLLDRVGDAFTQDERRFIRRVAGRHPFLLQAMAASLLETETGTRRCVQAAERFYYQVVPHFDEVWYYLDRWARATIIVVGLVELGQRALGWGFASREVEQIGVEHAEVFNKALGQLEERGWVERVSDKRQSDLQHVFRWRGEGWTVGAQAFAWWMRDVVVTKVKQVPAYEECLNEDGYRFLLAKEQWDWLLSAVRSAPAWALSGIGGLAQALFEESAEGA